MARLSARYRALVRLGARARLQELDRERTELIKLLAGSGNGHGRSNGDVVSAVAPAAPKRKFSAAARRRISAGMRKLWAKRRAASKSGAA